MQVLQQLLDHMLHDSLTMLNKCSNIMHKLVATTLVDLMPLMKEFQNLLTAQSFEKMLDVQAPAAPEEYLADVMASVVRTSSPAGSSPHDELAKGKDMDDIKDPHQAQQALEKKAPPKSRKEELLEDLTRTEGLLVRVHLEITTNHRPLLRGLAEQSLEFAESIEACFAVHKTAGKNWSREDASSELEVLLRRMLTAKGIIEIDKFLTCSEIFHMKLRDYCRCRLTGAVGGMDRCKQQLLPLLRKMDAVVQQMEAQRKQVVQLKEEVREAGEVGNEKLEQRVGQIAEESRQLVRLEVLGLAQDTPRGLKSCFELLDGALGTVAAAFGELRVVCEQAGYAEEDLRHLAAADGTESVLKLPADAAEAVQQGRCRAEPFVPLQTNLTGYSAAALQLVGKSFGAWQQTCWDLLPPTGVPADATNSTLPKELVALLPSGSLTPYLHLIKAHPVRVSEGSLPMNGSLVLASEVLLFHGSSLGRGLTLMIPRQAITGAAPISNFFGKENGLKLDTVRGEVQVHLKDKQSRDCVIGWLRDASLRSFKDCAGLQEKDVQCWLRLRDRVVEVPVDEQQAQKCRNRSERTKRTLFWLGEVADQRFSAGLRCQDIGLYALLPLLLGSNDLDHPDPGLLLLSLFPDFTGSIDMSLPYACLPSLPLDAPTPIILDAFLAHPMVTVATAQLHTNSLLLTTATILTCYSQLHQCFILIKHDKHVHVWKVSQHQHHVQVLKLAGTNRELWTLKLLEALKGSHVEGAKIFDDDNDDQNVIEDVSVVPQDVSKHDVKTDVKEIAKDDVKNDVKEDGDRLKEEKKEDDKEKAEETVERQESEDIKQEASNTTDEVSAAVTPVKDETIEAHDHDDKAPVHEHEQEAAETDSKLLKKKHKKSKAKS